MKPAFESTLIDSFDRVLDNYAQVVVRAGVNVQPGQIVNVRGEVIHRDLALRIAKAAYDAGAVFVNLELIEPRLRHHRLKVASKPSLDFVPSYLPEKYRQLVDEVGANVAIVGEEHPGLLADIDPKLVNSERISARRAVEYFYEKGISKGNVHWCVVAGATPAWGQRLFPNVEPQEAQSRLWDQLFRVCRAYSSNPLEVWKEHDKQLRARAKILNDLKIAKLRFRRPGTDLIVSISEIARFRAGASRSPRGVDFIANIPTEECFTTPNWRGTSGTLSATRPIEVNGVLVEGLVLEFKAGEIVRLHADKGEDVFAEYVQSDPGGRRLGEVALVSTESPVYQSGLVFEEILLDENAACHVAVGSAYKHCLERGEYLSREELDRVGCNESSVHTDIMISDEETDVWALTRTGREILIIKKGKWREL